MIIITIKIKIIKIMIVTNPYIIIKDDYNDNDDENNAKNKGKKYLKKIESV